MNPFSALVLKDFRTYWFGSLFAMFGHRLIIVAISLLIYRLTGSALSLGIVAAASAIPIMLFNFLGGIIADKYNVKKILFFLAFLIFIVLIYLGYLDITNKVETYHVYVCSIILGILLGIDFPARNSYFPKIVSQKYLRSSISLNGATMAGSSVIVPTIGGLLISVYGTSIGIFLSAFGYLIMSISTFFLPNVKGSSESSSNMKFFTEGMSFILKNELFYYLILMTYFTNFFIFGYIQALPAFIDIFDGTEKEVGFMFSCAGLGALTGLLTAGKININKHLGKIIISSATFFSMMMILVSLVGTELIPKYIPFTNILLIFPLAIIGHFGNGFYMLSTYAVIQSKVPENIRGRVMGILAIHISLGVLGGLWVGGIGEIFSIRLGVGIGPVICLVLFLYIFIFKKSIRKLENIN
ncbi:MAG: MFS transporter [Dehalococcoidales bacterium]|nr:MFS transporter [Dehalococcoidales bacterium]